MKNRVELLLHGWDHAYDKEDWYPPLLDALKGVTAEQAVWLPQGFDSLSTIWGNVNHLIFYKERLLKRWLGKETGNPLGVTNDDTFAVPEKSEAAWQETLARLDRVHKEIRHKISAMKEEDFDQSLPDHTIGRALNSLIAHDAYHTGEIILLRKMQGSWPARRHFD
ncbi:DinB family protein [Cohnella pontilimi]|uniref:DinB family protein n=1 Tax=Cohnella pontilimi TaxID=2564100 RepID=A0A4U0F8D0_9BACL|nr:DinB family protein [Cohnella pontilimi]TJY40937.1 DinB family protein [Cohnella pontilimi]